MVTDTRRIKLRKIAQYFLHKEEYDIFDVVTYSDDVSEGYFVNIVSTKFDYSTYLSNDYIDGNVLSEIRTMLENSVKTYMDDDE